MPLAVITGAGVRVGRAIALTFAEAGYDLVLHAHRSQAGLDEVGALARGYGRTVEIASADLSDTAGIDALGEIVVKRGQGVDVLIHNAGLYERVPFPAITRDHYRRMLSINVEAPFFLTQRLLPLLQRGKNPSVLAITDIAVHRPYAGYAHYMVSKAALDMLVRALAVELAPQIRVNAVAPGTVIFPENFDTAIRERILRRIPLGREGSAEDVARAALFLVRDAPYITGHVLKVDGGQSLG